MSVESTTTKSCVSGTVHDRFQEWRQDGVFKRMWIDGLKIYDEKIGINWKWQSMDGAISKAPLGEKAQDQTQQIGLKWYQTQSLGRGSRYSYWNYCRWC